MSGGAKAALSVLAFLLLAALAWLGFGRPGTNVRQDNSTTTIAVPDAANEAVDVVPPAPEATDSGNDLETNDLQAVEVAETRPTERLGGNWRRPDDASCSSPLNISIAGDQLTYVREGVTFVERIDQDEGSTVTATVQRINGSPTPPRQFTFRVADNGVQLYIASEVWLRCRISVMRLE
jgi:hypothetical protein